VVLRSLSRIHAAAPREQQADRQEPHCTPAHDQSPQRREETERRNCLARAVADAELCFERACAPWPKTTTSRRLPVKQNPGGAATVPARTGPPPPPTPPAPPDNRPCDPAAPPRPGARPVPDPGRPRPGPRPWRRRSARSGCPPLNSQL